MVPPPPWTRVLRPSSLAAVTSFVMSRTPNPSSAARCLTSARSSETSGSVRTGRTSLPRTLAILLLLRLGAEKRHTLFHVQGRAYPGHLHSHLDQGDGHGGLHPDQDGLRVHQTSHLRDGAQDAGEERVHGVEGGDIDEHAAGARGGDAGGEIVIEH